MAVATKKTKSLKYRAHQLSQAKVQLEILGDTSESGVVPFHERLKDTGLFPLKPVVTDVFQINVGYMCNQVCKHCHVDAGPDRKEIMTTDTMQECLDVLKTSSIKTVDLTGGAPEMNPDFRWFVEEISKLGKHIIVRSNLTILTANKKYNDLPEFFKKHKVEVTSSLPYFAARRTDAQRGEGVFEQSINGLKMLNAVGYGKKDSGLILNLVHNPSGAFLPDDQSELEKVFKNKLKEGWDIEFNELFAITNLPVSRFLEHLVVKGQYDDYLVELANAYNPVAAAGVMCRNTISVSWDGYLYDCDFNQMLELKVQGKAQHLRDYDQEELDIRNIIVNQHCFGCTAGAGSSCGGTVA
ncbi:MAG: radical SAM/Cys-rich protein [Glaciecola sp.]|jgi:radical SAM/Cys-rich protein